VVGDAAKRTRRTAVKIVAVLAFVVCVASALPVDIPNNFIAYEKIEIDTQGSAPAKFEGTAYLDRDNNRTRWDVNGTTDEYWVVFYSKQTAYIVQNGQCFYCPINYALKPLSFGNNPQFKDKETMDDKPCDHYYSDDSVPGFVVASTDTWVDGTAMVRQKVFANLEQSNQATTIVDYSTFRPVAKFDDKTFTIPYPYDECDYFPYCQSDTVFVPTQ